jgi:FMN phosphatase YigB (HAD superfamily)
MLKGVLFDLDETLLDIRLFSFEHRYVRRLMHVFANYGNVSAPRVLRGAMNGVLALSRPHSISNRDVIFQAVTEATGCDITTPESQTFIESLIAEEIAGLRTDEKALPGATEALAACQSHGLKTALATNPYFPLAVTRERMSWAHIEQFPFDYISHWTNCDSVKPSSTYYRGVLEALHLQAEDCLMVGNDPKNDMQADQVGLRTFYVGQGTCERATWCGTLADLPTLIDELTVPAGTPGSGPLFSGCPTAPCGDRHIERNR